MPVLKRIISLLLVFVMAIAVTSCAGINKSTKWEIKDGILTVNADKNIGDFHNMYSAYVRDCYNEEAIPWYGQSFHTVIIEEYVSNIGEHSFTNSADLEKVVIKGQNVIVPECAFCYCENLKEIENMDRITDIGHYAFYGCHSLTSVSFGDKTESIGYRAFESCTNLKEVYFSKSVKEIEPDAFAYCTSLEKFVVDEDNPYITSLDGVLYSKDMKQLLIYPPGKKDSSFIVPKQVETIVDSAFCEVENLNEITVNNVYVEDSAFFKCNALETVIIEGKSEINSSSFFECTNFSRFEVKEHNPSHSVVDDVLYSADKKVLLCYPLNKTGETFTIPKEVEEIGASSFYNNKHIKSISFESNHVTTI